MIQVGDRVRICNLQAPFTYGALATVEIVEDRNPDGLAYICFDRLERITTSSNSNDRTRRWWIEKEYIEVVDFNEPASDESPTVEASTRTIALDEEIVPSPAWEATATAVMTGQVGQRVENSGFETTSYEFNESAQRAINEMSQQLRQRRTSTPPVWPDPGYGDAGSACTSAAPQETQAEADAPVESYALRERNGSAFYPT